MYPIEDVTVQSDAPDDVEISQEGSSTVIRIGDEDVEVSGRHTYTIAYRVEGALNAFAEHDELYWNAIGHEWEASILASEVTVRAPAAIQRVECFQGSQGRRNRVPSPTGRPGEILARRIVLALRGDDGGRGDPEGSRARTRPILEERWAADAPSA